MKPFFKKNRKILIILLLCLVLHLVFLPGFHETWWDSGVYAGMGKYFFSAGSSGLWEHIRPPVWPLLLGFFWLLKLDMLLFGRVLQILFSLGCVFLFYHISKHYFKERTAVISSVIFAFSPIFFYLSFHLYSEIPALFFVLLSFYLFVQKRFYFAGFFSAVGFLTKFPAGMFIAVLCFVLIANKKHRSLLKLAAGFLIPVVPVLFLYQVYYGSPFLPFIEAREAILSVLGCNVLRYRPWWHYFYLIVTENVLHLFAAIGLIACFRYFKKSWLLPALFLLVPLIYFSQLHCRDYRYLALFIPFVCMFTGYGISQTINKPDKTFHMVLLFVLGISLFHCTLFYLGNEITVQDPARTDYFRYLRNKSTEKEVWSANPTVAFFTDARINKIYYPVYNNNVSFVFNEYLKENSSQVGYVLLDNCGGGIICPPKDTACEEQTAGILSLLENNFNQVYSRESGRCWYLIFKA